MVLGRQIEIFRANLINLQTATGVYINTSSFRPLQGITTPSAITIITTTIMTNHFNNYIPWAGAFAGKQSQHSFNQVQGHTGKHIPPGCRGTQLVTRTRRCCQPCVGLCPRQNIYIYTEQTSHGNGARTSGSKAPGWESLGLTATYCLHRMTVGSSACCFTLSSALTARCGATC